jgi:hypothetical protein
VARFQGCRVKRRRGVMVGGGGCGLISWRQRGCSAFANARPGGGFGAKNPKPSVCGSVSGVPCETAAWGDGGRWQVQVGDIEAAWVLCICQCEAGGRGLGRKPETEPQSLVSGVPCKTVARGDGGRWWVRVGDIEVAWVLRVC